MTIDSADSGPDLAQIIARSGRAALTIAQLAGYLGLEEQVAELSVLLAFDAGHVDVWPGEEDRVTLTPHSAERLSVRLDSDGTAWLSRDVRQRPSVTKPSRARVLSATDANIGLDRIPSRVKPPDRIVMEAEERSRVQVEPSRFRPDPSVPLPTVLLGERLQWPCSAWQTADARPKLSAECPGCSGRLRPHEYCLVCDGYGRGWMLPRVQVARLRQLPRESRQADKPRAIRRAEKFARPG